MMNFVTKNVNLFFEISNNANDQRKNQQASDNMMSTSKELAPQASGLIVKTNVLHLHQYCNFMCYEKPLLTLSKQHFAMQQKFFMLKAEIHNAHSYLLLSVFACVENTLYLHICIFIYNYTLHNQLILSAYIFCRRKHQNNQ